MLTLGVTGKLSLWRGLHTRSLPSGASLPGGSTT
jgi:hypothetical protein